MHYIAYEKLSRKQRRLEDLRHRNDWGGLCPATRRIESRKVYDRARVKRETRLLLLC